MLDVINRLVEQLCNVIVEFLRLASSDPYVVALLS
jgi:hypothetical protein